MSRMMNRLQKNIGDSLVIPILSAAYVCAKQGKHSTIEEFAVSVREVMKNPPCAGEPCAELYEEVCAYLKGGSK